MSKHKLPKSVEKRFDERFVEKYGYGGGNYKYDWKDLYGGEYVGPDLVKQFLAIELSKSEIWKDLPDYEGLYKVSTHGQVKGLHRGEKVLSAAPDRDGAMNVVLCDGEGKRHTVKVHRLVAKVFIPNPDNKPEINHLDGDRSNNRIDNLEWCTRSENEKHAYKIGLKTMVGGKNFHAKLTEEQVREIRNQSTSSYIGLAVKYGVTPSCISSIMRRKTWKHVK